MTIVSLDVESTGVEPASDSIVSFAAIKWIGDDFVTAIRTDALHWLINPQRPIPPEATEIHGITDADVQEMPPFSARAQDLCVFCRDADVIVGFGILRFDILIIQEELFRCGIAEEFPRKGVHVIDCGNIFQKKERRTLEAAVEKYCGRKHEDAHDALADSASTFDVLIGQRAVYQDLGEMPLEDLAKFSRMDDMVDFAGKLRLNKAGQVVYGIGKARGVRVADDPGFGDWMLRQSWVTQDTRRHLEVALAAARFAEETEANPFH